VRTDDGEPLYFISAVQDINEKKQAEEELKLVGLVYKNRSEAMVVTNTKGKIIAINLAFNKMTGYELIEIKGKRYMILRSERHDRAFYKAKLSTILKTGQWQDEVWSKRKNGEAFPEWLKINTCYHNDGSVHQRVDLFSDMSDIKKAEELIQNQANYDQVTKLHNRRLFQDRLEQIIKKSQREVSLASILFIDLDRFKELNDTHGHNMGDMLLAEAAGHISKFVRNYDTVARFAGGEFSNVLPDIKDSLMVAQIPQQIINQLSEPFYLASRVAFVSASTGIAFYPQDATEIGDLLKNS
jgi:diguanylate cyclase (GGDEF)-like protein/PAS domain S-box-containing protein